MFSLIKTHISVNIGFKLSPAVIEAGRGETNSANNSAIERGLDQQRKVSKVERYVQGRCEKPRRADEMPVRRNSQDSGGSGGGKIDPGGGFSPGHGENCRLSDLKSDV